MVAQYGDGLAREANEPNSFDEECTSRLVHEGWQTSVPTGFYAKYGPRRRLLGITNILKTINYNLFRNILLGIIKFMTPSFLRGRDKAKTRPSSGQTPSSKVLALDGVRGIASVAVVIFHYAVIFIPSEADKGFGFDANHHSWYQLPFIRAVWSGTAWVSTFFLLSGVVLSKKPIRLVREQNTKNLAQMLSSTIFRRGFRLFLPPFISMIFGALFVWMGAYESGRKLYEKHEIVKAIEGLPPRLDGFWAQFVDFVNACYYMTQVIEEGQNGLWYNPHFWTIRLEFFGSLVLALVVLGLAGLKTWTRIIALIIISVCLGQSVGRNRTDCTLQFVIGILISEFQGIVENRNPQHASSPMYTPLSPQQNGSSSIYDEGSGKRAAPVSLSIKSFLRRAALFAGFLFGWLLISTPNIGFEATPCYRMLAKTPIAAQSWQRIGSVFVIVSVLNSSDVEKIFIHPVILYLGRISFALYIVHGYVYRTVMYSLIPPVWRMLDMAENPTRFGYGVAITTGITFPLTIWVADMFWRAADMPSVKFARWVENKLKIKEQARKAETYT